MLAWNLGCRCNYFAAETRCTSHAFVGWVHAVLQMRAVAEAAIRELQAKVKDREGQLGLLQSRMTEHQAAYMSQHAADRKEIEKLTAKLFESGAASIAGLKSQVAAGAASLAATGDGREEIPYEQVGGQCVGGNVLMLAVEFIKCFLLPVGFMLDFVAKSCKVNSSGMCVSVL